MTPDGSIEASQIEVHAHALAALPQAPAVFVIFAKSGHPYLARTAMLRTRALRLLGERKAPSRIFHLRDAWVRLEYWLTGSSLDSSMRLYTLAREHLAGGYVRFLRLRMPPYLKLMLSNPWPRSTITTYLGGPQSLAYGPFRSRAAAEQFEADFLDLYPIRRCQENLAPAPDHPGCMYGEMNKCVRPCQLAVGREEYGAEVARAEEFLFTNGRSLVRSITSARDSLSAGMDFEEAARQHRRLEKVEEILRNRGELAGNVDELHAAAVTRAPVSNAVDVFFLRHGSWQGSARIAFDLEGGKPVSIDRKLRDTWETVTARKLPVREKQERLAILARWFYSSWRDGELLVFPRFEDPPVRKLVNAISRVMAAEAGR